MVDASDPRITPSKWGVLMLLAPLVAIAVVFVLYAYLAYHGYTGRPAQGARTRVVFTGCEAARPVVAARAAAMGLADAELTPASDGFALVATFPGEADVAQAIPGTLAEGGHLTLTPVGATEPLVVGADLEAAGIRMDMMMRPETWIRFTPEARARVTAHTRQDPGGALSVAIDGVEVWKHSNQKEPGAGELDIPPSAEDDRGRMHLAARRGIILSDPLPCAVAVVSVTPEG